MGHYLIRVSVHLTSRSSPQVKFDKYVRNIVKLLFYLTDILKLFAEFTSNFVHSVPMLRTLLNKSLGITDLWVKVTFQI